MPDGKIKDLLGKISAFFRERWRQFGKWTSIVALIGTVITYVFTYFISPLLQPASISVTTDITNAGFTNDKIAIEIKVQLKNSSARKVWLLPSAFKVYGNKFSNDQVSEEQLIKNANDDLKQSSSDEDDASIHRYPLKDSEIVAFGHLYGSAWSFEKDETSTTSTIILIPKDEYQTLDFYFTFPTTYNGANVDSLWSISNDGELTFHATRNDNGKITAITEDYESILDRIVNSNHYATVDAKAEFCVCKK